jgi:hypothetical protein
MVQERSSKKVQSEQTRQNKNLSNRFFEGSGSTGRKPSARNIARGSAVPEGTVHTTIVSWSMRLCHK